MTERERVEATYKKVRQQHPDISDPQVLNQLAVKKTYGRTFLVAAGFFLACLLCAFLWTLDAVQGSFAGICLVFAIVCGFEAIRTICNSAKIKAHYPGNRPLVRRGILTYEQVCRDTGVQNPTIEMATLYDKDDRDDSMVSLIFHKYTLYFKLHNSVATVGLPVKRAVYIKAPLDAEYILALSPDNKVLATYIAQSWDTAGLTQWRQQ